MTVRHNRKDEQKYAKKKSKRRGARGEYCGSKTRKKKKKIYTKIGKQMIKHFVR